MNHPGSKADVNQGSKSSLEFSKTHPWSLIILLGLVSVPICQIAIGNGSPPMLVTVVTVCIGIVVSSDFRSYLSHRSMDMSGSLVQIDRILRLRICSVLLLYTLHLACARGEIRIFDLDSESGMGTVYSAYLLLTNSIICFCLSTTIARDDGRTFFGMLATLFAVMSIDELQEFHRQVPKYLYQAVTGHATGYTEGHIVIWVIMLAPVMAGVFFWILRGAKRYIPGDARWIAAAGVICWVVAVGLEGTIGVDLIPRTVESGVEETLEMLGVALFGASAALTLHLNCFRTIGVSDPKD